MLSLYCTTFICGCGKQKLLTVVDSVFRLGQDAYRFLCVPPRWKTWLALFYFHKNLIRFLTLGFFFPKEVRFVKKSPKFMSKQTQP